MARLLLLLLLLLPGVLAAAAVHRRCRMPLSACLPGRFCSDTRWYRSQGLFCLRAYVRASFFLPSVLVLQ